VQLLGNGVCKESGKGNPDSQGPEGDVVGARMPLVIFLDRVSRSQKSQKLCERQRWGRDPHGAHARLNSHKPSELMETHPVFNSRQYYKGEEAQGIQLHENNFS